jgi:hypothetical protein
MSRTCSVQFDQSGFIFTVGARAGQYRISPGAQLGPEAFEAFASVVVDSPAGPASRWTNRGTG